MMNKRYGIGLALLSVALLAGCGTRQSSQGKTTSQSTSTQSSSTKSVTATTKVYLTAAIKKFQQQFPNASVTSIELEDQLGRPVYTLEGVGGTQEHELQLNGRTGKVISKKSEMLDQDDQADAERDRLNLNKVISPSKAVAIAVHDRNGGYASELKLDKDNDTTYWEVQVHQGKQQVDVKIDAYEGSILETEHDD
ncbi:PepSY domain-containing protein [Lactiplantibacillus argentoratensis]|uniref:PepSY domain-containing protein n=1 Tax=Lactiplantibacillus argentoratensis TaxID=271881 RepID=UPI003D7830C5